jgi:hypothetical protein
MQRCRVTTAEQTHSRLVTLTRRSGKKVHTREPKIDDVVHELAGLLGKCGSIKVVAH